MRMAIKPSWTLLIRSKYLNTPHLNCEIITKLLHDDLFVKSVYLIGNRYLIMVFLYGIRNFDVLLFI